MGAEPQKRDPLETEPIHRLIPRYAVPTAMTLMVNCLYNLVDQIFVGQGVGITATAAVNVAFPMVILVNALSLMLGDGCAANMSLNLGRRNQAEADATVSHTVTLLLASGVCLGLVCGLLAPQIALLFGATDTALAEAADYLRVIAWGLPFQLLCPALTAVIRADGRPRYALRCMVLGHRHQSDPGPHLHLPPGHGRGGGRHRHGAGTGGGRLSLPVGPAPVPDRPNPPERPAAHLGPDGEDPGPGLPSFLTQILTALVQIVLNNLMRRCGAATVYGGDMALSVYGMMMKVYQISHAMFVGVSSAVSPINGYNFGARRYDRVRQTYRLAAAIALAISAVCFADLPALPPAHRAASSSPDERRSIWTAPGTASGSTWRRSSSMGSTRPPPPSSRASDGRCPPWRSPWPGRGCSSSPWRHAPLRPPRPGRRPAGRPHRRRADLPAVPDPGAAGVPLLAAQGLADMRQPSFS